MVDSRATTARPADNASETSEATFTLVDAPIALLTTAAYISNKPVLYTLLITYVFTFSLQEVNECKGLERGTMT